MLTITASHGGEAGQKNGRPLTNIERGRKRATAGRPSTQHWQLFQGRQWKGPPSEGKGFYPSGQMRGRRPSRRGRPSEIHREGPPKGLAKSTVVEVWLGRCQELPVLLTPAFQHAGELRLEPGPDSPAPKAPAEFGGVDLWGNNAQNPHSTQLGDSGWCNPKCRLDQL